MLGYIVRRLVISIPILLLVVTMVFFAFQLIPGDPARMYAGEQASAEVVERLRRDLGLDRPVLDQYVAYLGRLSRGDLGDSIFTRRPVMTEIQGRFWNTMKLSLSAIAWRAWPGSPWEPSPRRTAGISWITSPAWWPSSASRSPSSGWGCS